MHFPHVERQNEKRIFRVTQERDILKKAIAVFTKQGE